MCQDEQTPETSTTPVSEENEQQKQVQKPEKKKQKPQKQDKPPTPPLRPLHEALKEESSKIANGARYIDVLSFLDDSLTIDSLSYIDYTS
jgi:hypothetical protein